MAGERAPAAANIEHRLAGLEAQLAADHVEFLDLRLFEIVAPVMKISAAIDHLLVEPELIEGVGDIVMMGDVFLVLARRSVALAIGGDRLQGPGAAARDEQKIESDLQRAQLAQRFG